MFTDFRPLEIAIREIPSSTRYGKVVGVDASVVRIGGLSRHAHVGDQITISKRGGGDVGGEIIALTKEFALAMPYGTGEGIAINDAAKLERHAEIKPADNWIGRIIDAFGNPLDGRPLFAGDKFIPLRRSPPPAATRRELGDRLETGLTIFNTMLPIARGQRIGVFAGSGVGKSTLLANLAKGIDCDVVVIGLIGERGRELGEFVNKVLGPEGLKKSIIIAATSDQSPLSKRRAAWTTMAVSEYFRDRGKHVLLLMDSVTRFAEAHREIALTAGEAPSLRAYPPSTSNLIAGLAERAGPGPRGSADITAVFSVLVAGSDMEEPIADITRGVLDGHIVMDREIAERGRFPAIDINRSVSRSLPTIATETENSAICAAKRLIATYEQATPMTQTGLYSKGTDPFIDESLQTWPLLEAFFSEPSSGASAKDFESLAHILDPSLLNKKPEKD